MLVFVAVINKFDAFDAEKVLFVVCFSFPFSLAISLGKYWGTFSIYFSFSTHPKQKFNQKS
jgi:hypothetical protein